MKKALYFLLLLVCSIFFSCAQVEPNSLEAWNHDLDHFERKILSNFVGWNDSEKNLFVKEINDLRGELPNLSREAIITRISTTLVPLGDGHTELSLLQEATQFKRIPVIFYRFGGDIRIVASFENNKELLGGKVLSINGVAMNSVYTKICDILAHDNEIEFLHEAPNYMSVPEILVALNIGDDAAEVVLQVESTNGMIKEVALKAITREKNNEGNWTTARAENGSTKPFYLDNRSDNYWFKNFKEYKVTYVKFNRIDNQKGTISLSQFVKELFEEFDNSGNKNIVVDLRNNRGGNYKKIRPLIESIADRQKQDKMGKVFCITNRVTFSAAGVTSIFLKRENNAILVGEPSRSEPNGGDNVEYFNLPHSKLRVGYTNKLKDHYPELGDKKILPVDIFVDISYQDYINGRDRMIEEIFKTLE